MVFAPMAQAFRPPSRDDVSGIADRGCCRESILYPFLVLGWS